MSSSGPGQHMGAEAPYSFKEVSGGPPYYKLTTRHSIFRYYSVFFFIDLQKQGYCELVLGLMGNPKASK